MRKPSERAAFSFFILMPDLKKAKEWLFVRAFKPDENILSAPGYAICFIINRLYFSFGRAKSETTSPDTIAAVMPTLAEESGPSRTPRRPFSATASFVPFARE